jgi:hypothetical protein
VDKRLAKNDREYGSGGEEYGGAIEIEENKM